MNASHIHAQRLNTDACPTRFRQLAGLQRLKRVYWTGDIAVLDLPWIAVFAPRSISSTCLLKAYGVFDALAAAPVALAGGWHSTTEKDLLTRLVAKHGRVVFDAARGIEHCNLDEGLLEQVSNGRALVFSCRGPQTRRVTRENALKRNAAVVEMSDAVFVPHATPGTQTFKIVRAAIDNGKPAATVADTANEPLVAAGATACDSASIHEWLTRVTSREHSPNG